jgi:hypothetical protein
LVIVITKPFANQSTVNILPTATTAQIGANPTTPVIDPTSVDISSVPKGTASPEPSDFPLSEDALNALVDVLEPFNVLQENVVIDSTNLGNTLVVDVCAQAGADLREKLPQVMEELAKNYSIYENAVQAISTRMVDCDTNTPLLAIGVPLTDVVAYADGTLDEEAFQAKWKPIG